MIAKKHSLFTIFLFLFPFYCVYSDSSTSIDINKPLTFINSIDGYSTLRYRAQSLEGGTSDQDFYQYLSLSIGDLEKDKLSFYFYGTLHADIDDSSNSITKEDINRLRFFPSPRETNPFVSNNPFFSVDDSIQDGFFVRPYEFYADIKDVAIFKEIRVGRQYLNEVENLHFDGLKLSFENPNGIRAATFVGKPVHLFETSASGDFLIGWSIEYQPLKNSRVMLNYAYVNDHNDDLSDNDNNFVELRFRYHLKKWWNIFANYSMIDKTSRDAEIRSDWLFPELNLNVNLTIFKQLSVLEDYAIEFDYFNYILGDYFPYTEYSIRVYKGFLDNFGLAAGFNLRELNDKSNEGVFNHSFNHYYITLSSHDFPFKGSTVSITNNFYNTDDNDTRSIGFNFRQKLNEKWRFSAGTNYSLFKYDVINRTERDNVRTVFLNTKYNITKKIEIELDYEFESFDQERFHTIETSLKYDF